MSVCPPIDKLLEVPLDSDVLQHTAQCEACRSVATLATLAQEECEVVEPWLTAAHEGSLPSAERARLLRHLMHCEGLSLGRRRARPRRNERTGGEVLERGDGVRPNQRRA